MRPKAPKHRKTKRRLIDEGHLRMVRQLPCILSGRPAEAAHISYGDLDHEKPHNAMGIKADDKYVVPLCPELHRLASGAQHNHGEREWWEQFGVDPVRIALDLWGVGRNHEAQFRIVQRVELTAEARARVEAILRGE